MVMIKLSDHATEELLNIQNSVTPVGVQQTKGTYALSNYGSSVDP